MRNKEKYYVSSVFTQLYNRSQNGKKSTSWWIDGAQNHHAMYKSQAENTTSCTIPCMHQPSKCKATGRGTNQGGVAEGCRRGPGEKLVGTGKAVYLDRDRSYWNTADRTPQNKASITVDGTQTLGKNGPRTENSSIYVCVYVLDKGRGINMRITLLKIKFV